MSPYVISILFFRGGKKNQAMPLTVLKIELGKRIETCRNLRELSQDELAYLSGCDKRTIQRIENGEEGYSLTALNNVIKALSVTPDSILLVSTGNIQILTPQAVSINSNP
jgi:transcriptional regulator with XRE-family HTH domain